MAAPLTKPISDKPKTPRVALSSHNGAEDALSWRRSRKWSRPCMSTAALSVLMLAVLFVGRHYLHGILVYLSALRVWQSFLLLLVMFVAVSFPFAFGYMLLNIASGYLYGFRGGVLAASVCAGVGVFLSLIACRRWFRDSVQEWLEQSHLGAVPRIVEGAHGFRVVALMRLTPIPFGLQNACFAVTGFPVWRCCLASMIGLLPAQIFNSHLGSTVRFMEELYTHQWDSYLLIVIQFIVLCSVLVYVAYLARQELSASSLALPPPLLQQRSSSVHTLLQASESVAGHSDVEAATPPPARFHRHSRSWSHPIALQFV